MVNNRYDRSIYESRGRGTTLTVHLDASSRICLNCGKNHSDELAKSLQNALSNVHHRHAVLTIPNVLWHSVRNNRFLLKVLMDAGEKQQSTTQFHASTETED